MAGAAKKRRPLPERAKAPPARPPRPGRRGPVTAAEAVAWYHGKTFSADWTSWHFPNWITLLAPYRRRSVRMLEIGSWEGRSALFFLNYLPRARLTCIDTFAGGQEHREAAAEDAAKARTLRGVEKSFDRNTAAFKDRIEKIKAGSAAALVALGLEKRRFDIAYIDGGHRAGEVYSDAALTWPLMAKGGLMIFDDYEWREMPEPMDNPGPGIDAFLATIKDQHRVALNGYQIAIEKL